MSLRRYRPVALVLVVLHDTRVVGDTAIAGWLGGVQERRRTAGDLRRFILMSDVLHVEGGSVDPLRTLGAVAGIGIAVVGVLLMIACADSNFC